MGNEKEYPTTKKSEPKSSDTLNERGQSTNQARAQDIGQETNHERIQHGAHKEIEEETQKEDQQEDQTEEQKGDHKEERKGDQKEDQEGQKEGHDLSQTMNKRRDQGQDADESQVVVQKTVQEMPLKTDPNYSQVREQGSSDEHGQMDNEEDTKNITNNNQETEQESAYKDVNYGIENNVALEYDAGPFNVCPLIQTLPSELDYTDFEAYNENIYLGTSTGDLLHYFEIEPRNYMLVSQTKFDTDSTHKIDKIMLLPKIERALVLSNRTLVVFLLPEFAPAPNTLKIRGVNDVTLRNYSEHSNSYKVYIGQRDHIKQLRITNNAITLLKSYDFKKTGKLKAHDHILAIEKTNNYEILDLKNLKTIPLFRVSESTAPLRPVITSFNKSEFLIATGGASQEDSSMALIVNHIGDIVNGTLVLENYPLTIEICAPYIIVCFEHNGVCIYRMGDTPEVIQRMRSHTSSVRIASTTKVFNNFKDSDLKKKVVEKLRKVSLIKDGHQIRTDNERVLMNELFNEESSLVIYGKSGIHVLLKQSVVLDFTHFEECYIEEIKTYLKQSRFDDNMSQFKQVEYEYLTMMMLLISLLHSKNINTSLVSEWYINRNYVDIRLLFYILKLDAVGNIWVPNGLVEKIEKFKALKLINKCDDVLKLLEAIKLMFCKKENLSEISNDIIRSIDINIFKLGINGDKKALDISYFDERSLEELTKIAEENPTEHLDILLSLYERRNMFLNCLKLLKQNKQPERIIKFLSQNIVKFPASYIKESLIDDLLLAIKEHKSINAQLINEIVGILQVSNVDPRSLISKAGEDSNIKALIIENLGAHNPGDKQYLAEYYIMKLQNEMEEKELWNSVAEFTASYTDDMDYSKCSFGAYLLIKIKHNEKFVKFLELLESIKTLYSKNDNYQLLDNIVDQIKPIDIGHTLMLLFLETPEQLSRYFTKTELFDISLAFNDFLNIEAHLDDKNMIIVLDHYSSLQRRGGYISLIPNLLVRNQKLATDKKQLITILQHVPDESNFESLFTAIFSFMKKIETQKRDLDLKKALLKDEINIHTTLIGNIYGDSS